MVDELMAAVVELTGQTPTAMMLRVILEDLGVAIEWAPLSEFGFKVPTS